MQRWSYYTCCSWAIVRTRVQQSRKAPLRQMRRCWNTTSSIRWYQCVVVVPFCARLYLAFSLKPLWSRLNPRACTVNGRSLCHICRLYVWCGVVCNSMHASLPLYLAVHGTIPTIVFTVTLYEAREGLRSQLLRSPQLAELVTKNYGLYVLR